MRTQPYFIETLGNIKLFYILILEALERSKRFRGVPQLFIYVDGAEFSGGEFV